MSKGLVWLQRECLRVIKAYDAAGKLPTTFNIAAEIYQIKKDQLGNRWVSNAQHLATERALAALRKSGLVSGEQKITILSDGTKLLSLASDGRAVCCWSLKRFKSRHSERLRATPTKSGAS